MKKVNETEDVSSKEVKLVNTTNYDMYDEFPYGIAEFDLHLSYHHSKPFYMNKEAKRIYELGNKGYSFLYELDGQKMERLRNKVAKTGKTQSFLCRLGNDTGKVIWISGICAKKVNKEGKDILQSVFTDATSRMKTLDLNDKDKSEILQILTNTNLQYWEYDIKNEVLYLGKIYQTGNNQSTFIDHFPENYIENGYLHPDDAEEYVTHIRELQKGKRTVSWEARLKNQKIKKWVWNKISYVIDAEEEGTPVHAIGIAQDISEKKEIENRLMQVKKQNGIMTWIFDSVKHSILANEKQAQDMAVTFGMTETEIPDVPESMIQNKMIFVDDVDTYRKMYDRIYAGETLVTESIRIWNVSELEYVWYQVIFSVTGKIGTVDCTVVCTCQDISSFKKAEARYQEEIMYHKEIASAVIAVVRVNLSQNYVEEINVGEKTLPKESIKEKIDFRDSLGLFMDHIRISDEDNQKFSPQKLLQLYNNGTHKFTYDFSARLMPEKQMARIRTEVRMLERSDREDVIAFFYHQNITEEFCKNCFIDQYIEQKTDFAGLLFQESGDFYLYASQNNGKKVHTDYEQFIHVYLKMYALPEEIDSLLEKISKENIVSALEKEDVWKVQISLKAITGEMRRKEFLFMHGNRAAGVITIMCHDIEDKLLELEKQNQEIEQAHKETENAIREKHDFLSRMSHEIRTPMNVIMGITSLVEKDLDNHEAIRDYLSKIDVSSRHLLNLINDVWDMARIESGEFVLNPVVTKFEEMEEQVDSMLLPILKTKKVQLIKNMMPSHMSVVIDKVRLTQVFFNLLSNAVNFTPENGKIYVDYRFFALSKRQVCDFEIEHAGVGMNEEYQKTMFEPFRMQKGEEDSNVLQGANGLGMSMAKAVIENMGGTLTVNSKVGQGTTFHVHLVVPIAAEKVEKVEETKPQYEEQFLKGKRILLVEDHPLNQTIAVRLLKNMGANVVTANDGQQGVDVFDESINDYFDAILMDIRMPVMDGLTASKIIRSMKREDAKRIPIIAMTANAYEADKEKSYEAGMTAHLSKPIEPKVLYQTLQNALNKVTDQQENEKNEE